MPNDISINTPSKQRPTSPEVEEAIRLTRAGSDFYEKGDLEAAASAYRKAIELRRNVIALVGLIKVYWDQENWNKVVRIYRIVMYNWLGKSWGSNIPDEFEHLVRFAYALVQIGEIPEAGNVYRRVIPRAPDTV